MKSLRVAAPLFVSCLFLICFFCACGWFQSDDPPAGDLPPDRISSITEPTSLVSVPPEGATSQNASSPPAQVVTPSRLPENMQDESIPMPAHSEVPPTDDAAFNEVFAQNPIDAHYNQSGAASVQEMVQTATECASLWQAEIDAAYQKLLTLMDAGSAQALTAEQDEWLAGQQAELEKIQTKATGEDGSNASLVAANLTMQYYRERAAELYLKLYSYDKNFTYAYQG